MGEILSQLGRFAKRPASLCLVVAFVVAWLGYSWARSTFVGDTIDASAVIVEDAVVVYLIAALIQVCVARYLGREAMALDRPRLAAWFVLTIVQIAGIYALAFVLQILAFLLARDAIDGWPWHQAAEGAVATAVLFPLAVWQMALLTGVRGVGLRQSWSGVWRDRPAVVVTAAALYFLLFAGQPFLMAVMPDDADGIALALWSTAVLLPPTVGYVLSVLLAFVTFLAIWQKTSAAQTVFD